MSSDIFPVVFGICLDAEAIWTGQNPEAQHRPVMLSQGVFAVREALNPLLDLLDENGVRSTFFIPGVTADKYPDAVRLIQSRGHEFGSHGYNHRSVLTISPEEDAQEMVQGIEAIERITKIRPRIWRSPSWEWSPRSMDLMLANGVDISTNFHDTLRPYRHTRDGKPVSLVELPVQWHLADAPYFRYGGQIGRVIHSAAQVEAIWQEEFDALYEMPGTFFHLTLHVQLIGHPGRMKMLQRFTRHMRGHSRVRFMNSTETAALVP